MGSQLRHQVQLPARCQGRFALLYGLASPTLELSLSLALRASMPLREEAPA
jgi:hypothetical protein